MEMRVLGATGMRVSPFCLGAMMLGENGNPDHEACIAIIHRALDAGLNFIDTADGYSRGESEEIVGKAIQGQRDRLIVATKFWAPMSDTDPNMRGTSRRWIVQEVENSLRRLGTDYIDLYQVHRWDDATDLEELLFTLTELVRQGKIRQFGTSAFPADRIVESHWTAERRGLLRPRSEQPPYSIFNRDAERFVLPACKRYGMGVLTYSPLDGGYLSGKYRSPDDLAGENRIAHYAKRARGSFDPHADWVRRKLNLLPELIAIADELGVTIAQLSVAFVINHPAVTAAIIGPRTMEQLEGLLPAAELTLSAEVLDRIDALVPPGTTLSPIGDMPSGTTKLALRR